MSGGSLPEPLHVRPAREREGEHVPVDADRVRPGHEQPCRPAQPLQSREDVRPRRPHPLQGERPGGSPRRQGLGGGLGGAGGGLGRSGCGHCGRRRHGHSPLGFGRRCRAHQHASHHELQLQARGRRPGHLVQRGHHDIGGATESLRAHRGGLARHPSALALGHPGQHRGGALAGRGQHDQVPQPLQQVVHEPARVLAGLQHPFHRVERRRRVLPGEGVGHFVQQFGGCVAEQRNGPVVRHPPAVGTGDELVQHRQRVAGRAAARAHHQRQDARIDLDVLAGAHLLDVAEHGRRRDEPERVVVRAGADGADHLLRFRGREDELHVVGGLLHELEQRVEALRSDHVRLVEDEDLETVARGREDGALAQVPGVVDAVVARSVDLDHIQGPAATASELHATGANAARGVGGAVRAVQAAGEDARGGGLAAAPRPREQVGVADPVAAQRGHQRLGDLLLPDHLAERLRTVPAVEGGGHASTLGGGADTGIGRCARFLTRRRDAPAPRPRCSGCRW